MTDSITFKFANTFKAAFDKAQADGSTFRFADEESSHAINTANEFIQASKDVEICHLAIKLPSGSRAMIQFTADDGLVLMNDYSDNEELESYFGKYLELEA